MDSIPAPARPRLLLVDDVKANLLLLAKALGQDYECRLATDGASALEQAISDPPDLILLDVMMPGLDGYEVCRRLKADPRTINIPVIFLTHLNEEADEKAGLEAGAIDYITKPFRFPIIKARVRNHLELKRRGDLLEQLAGMDGLTGIPNRRRFDETLTLEWNRTRRHGAPLALILLDIDFFKSYNDHYGHPQGDDCLRKVAAVLAATLQRASDTLARYGGEEFAAILPDTSLDSAVDMAELMRCRVMDLAIPHGYSRVAACVTVSLGVAACIPAERNSAAELVEAADGALYQAKHAGRNRVGR
ncbi:MAG TPA: diguanylate cyclase [Candidatus Contendobacter sp.]|nr:diguanylate cyclase [Candidatus Contendobacter sp.]